MPERSDPPKEQPQLPPNALTPVKNRFGLLSGPPEEASRKKTAEQKKKDKNKQKKENLKRNRKASVRSEPPPEKKEKEITGSDSDEYYTPPSSPIGHAPSPDPFSFSAENSPLPSVFEQDDEEEEEEVEPPEEPPKIPPKPVLEPEISKPTSNFLQPRASLTHYKWKADRKALDWSAIAVRNGCPWTMKEYHKALSELYAEKKEEQYKQLFHSYNSFMDPEMLCLYHLPGPDDRWGEHVIEHLENRIEAIRNRSDDLKRPMELILLTGRGKRNQDKKAVIKENVEQYLKAKKYDCENDNEGQISVYFSYRGRGTVEETSGYKYFSTPKNSPKKRQDKT